MLIDNWKDAWKMLTVIAGSLLAMFDAAYATDLFGMAAVFTPETVVHINAFIAALIPVLRVIKQQSLQPKEPQ